MQTKDELTAKIMALAQEYKQIKQHTPKPQAAAVAPKAERKAIFSKLKNLVAQINALNPKTN